METQTWFDKWRDKIILIIIVISIIGGALYFHPPKIKHVKVITADVNTLDIIMIRVNWTVDYKSKIFFTDNDKEQVESKLKAFVWSRISNITTKKESFKIYRMGIDSLRLLLNHDEQIRKLKSMNINVRINNIQFESKFMHKLAKIDSVYNKITNQYPNQNIKVLQQ